MMMPSKIIRCTFITGRLISQLKVSIAVPCQIDPYFLHGIGGEIRIPSSRKMNTIRVFLSNFRRQIA
ncbi:hypothetical protein ACR52_15205 [Pseudomonas fildesensis]|uniref:Uncharacterized protein n=1 Tax=Pseudomonas fildesensis TaxID=1674920 RepID=A0A0J8G1C6_9PSED|nr:hypothetical protein ACR52_15205 [Pseudomonas fildesensis]